jgi:hypothetical protein
MTRLHTTLRVIGAATAVAMTFVASACTRDVTAPPLVVGSTAARRASGDVRADEQLHFPPAADGAPTVANPVVSFYAKVGTDRTVRMYYHARPGATDSVVLVKFKVGKRSLLARPDGTRFADGDSVLITLTLVDTARRVVDFQPAGLRFSSADPAELEMSYAETEIADPGTLALLRIWKRERETEPWTSVATVLDAARSELAAPVFGFTGYAVAY